MRNLFDNIWSDTICKMCDMTEEEARAQIGTYEDWFMESFKDIMEEQKMPREMQIKLFMMARAKQCGKRNDLQ